jgi:ABC-type lipoprotein release transport system permease subunit
MKNGWSDISTEKIEEFFKEGKSVVLGSNIAIEYGVKVGDKIKIKSPDYEFSVLHILPETKNKDDQSIFVPLFLAQEWFNQEGYVTSIAVSVKEIGKIKATSKEIEKITDVQAVTMNEIVDMLTKYIDMLKWLMTGILLIVVFSSTLQIFNVMMLNTLEQIKKIAVIKIFGATKEQISFVIVFQSLLLAILGFAFGLLLYVFLAQPLTHLIGLLYKTYISSNVVLLNLKTVSIPFVITLLSVTLSSIYPIYLSNSKKPIMMLHDNVNL